MFITSLILKKEFRKHFPSHWSASPYLKYKNVNDFPDLEAIPFSFKRGKFTLRGNRYRVKDKDYKAIIVLFHGMGYGHLSYMTEIAKLAREGYLVYAYDNAYCADSDGEGFFSLSSSVVDQKAFFKWLDTDEYALNKRRYAIGHSRGGFTSICSLYDKKYKIEKMCDISGFISVKSIIFENSPKLKKVSFLIYMMNFRYFGKYGSLDGLKILKKTDKKALIIHGENDKVVDYEKNFLKLKEELKDKDNIEFLSVPNKDHQPQYSERAQVALNEVINSGIPEGKVIPVPELDYDLLTEQDEAVWSKIIKFFND